MTEIAAGFVSGSAGAGRFCSSFMPAARRRGTFCGVHSSVPAQRRCRPRLMMVFGPGGGGFLGVGPLEAGVVLVVAWVVLGPQEMLKAAREGGKLIGRARVWAAETQASLRETADLDTVEREIRETVDAVRAPLDAVRAPRTKKSKDEEEDKDEAEKEQKKSEKDVDEPVTIEGGLAEEDVKAVDRSAPKTRFQDQLDRLDDPDQVSPWENGVAAATAPVVNNVPESLSVDEGAHKSSKATQDTTDEDEELRELEEVYRKRRKEILRKKIAALDSEISGTDKK